MSLALCREFTGHRWIPGTKPVTRKMFPFDDVIVHCAMIYACQNYSDNLAPHQTLPGILIMMTSSNGNIFRVTGPLCGEFTGPGEFPTQRPVTRSYDVFFDLRLNKQLSKQSWGWWLRHHQAHYDVIVIISVELLQATRIKLHWLHFLPTEINECESNPCINDGACTDEVNRFFCSCLPGYTGERCDVSEYYRYFIWYFSNFNFL